ncbi:MAG: pyruvoyl-dependent arginine decarboxylase [archaeon]
MKIIVTFGIGEGETELSAFDNALFNAGIANLNLIKLSSVIPKGSDIIIDKFNKKFNYGDKLYCVLSGLSTSVKGKTIYSGLGWVQDKEKKGLFVEHHGNTEEEVKRLIKDSLNSMIKYRKEEFGEINYKITGTGSGAIL